MDYGSSAAAGGIVAIFVIAYLGFLLVVLAGAYVLQGLSYGQLFRKVGVEPWIAWVPYYNTWKLFEVGSQPGWMVLLALVPGGNIAVLVFLGFTAQRIGISFAKDSSWIVLAILLPWLWCFLLARQQEVYDPSRLAWFGYPPPLAGYGSVRPWEPPQQGPPPAA